MKNRKNDGKSDSRLKALWHALDEAAFGVERTLNLRESLPTGSEARRRAESWLRSRQVTRSEEVLIITGRGNQSHGGIGVIRQEILALLPALRRKGIVESWREHSPGSLVVRVAPLSALIDAGKRRRDARDESRPDAGSITGLQPGTQQRLRELAIQHLSALGVASTEAFIQKEMERTFSMLALSVRESTDHEAALNVAIAGAMEEITGR